MTTATLSKREAATLLADATQQHQKLADQFSELQSRLSQTEPGTEAFTVLAHQAADMKAQLQQLTSKIQELELQATTEAERKARAEQQAAAEAERAALEAQSSEAFAQAEALIETINSHSDALAKAIAELVNLQGWKILRQTGKLSLDLRNRSPQRVLWELPYVSRIKAVARLQQRTESGLKDRV